jgi:hypothetical protein
MKSRGLRNETPGHESAHIVANTEPRMGFPHGRPRVERASQVMGGTPLEFGAEWDRGGV